MRVLNLNTLKLENIRFKYMNVCQIDICIDSLLKKSYKDYTKDIDLIIESIDEFQEMTKFEMNLITNDELNFDDVMQIYLYASSKLCAHLTTKESREREKRLSIPNGIDSVYLNCLSYLQMVNNKTKLDIFTIEFKYENISINMIK